MKAASETHEAVAWRDMSGNVSGSRICMIDTQDCEHHRNGRQIFCGLMSD